MPHRQVSRLKRSVLWPLSIALGLLLAAFGWNIQRDSRRQLDDDLKNRFNAAWALYQNRASAEAELLRTAIEILIRNRDMKQAFADHDRDALFRLTQPLLGELKAKHKITHFYFHDANRRCFLRVYHPETFGDEIRRETLLEAERTGRVASGIESGSLEGPTLRVVYPWVENGSLLGYVELGMEITNIVEKLHTVLQMEVVTLVPEGAEESEEEEEEYEKPTKPLQTVAGPDGSRYSLYSSTLNSQPTNLSRFLGAGPHDILSVGGNGFDYAAKVFRLQRPDGSDALVLIALSDVTRTMRRRKIMMITMASFFTILGVGLFFIFYMILDRVEAHILASGERELKLQEQAQVEKLVSMGILVSGVAHEINNPANFIMFNAPTLGRICNGVQPVLESYRREHGDFQVAGMNYSECREQIPKMIDGIVDGADRIKRIVAQLKDFAHDSVALRRESIDVNAVVESAVQFQRRLIDRSTEHFSVHPAPDLPAIQGDYHRLEQVVINLLANACQALPSSERAIRVRTKSDVSKNAVVVEVEDEGVGIPEANLSKLTDPFFTTRRDRGGTGLGLSVSYGIVREHGGRLEYESTEGRGTIARVVLPLNSTEST